LGSSFFSAAFFPKSGLLEGLTSFGLTSSSFLGAGEGEFSFKFRLDLTFSSLGGAFALVYLGVSPAFLFGIFPYDYFLSNREFSFAGFGGKSLLSIGISPTSKAVFSSYSSLDKSLLFSFSHLARISSPISFYFIFSIKVPSSKAFAHMSEIFSMIYFPVSFFLYVSCLNSFFFSLLSS
jgi:hypothetical protein